MARRGYADGLIVADFDGQLFKGKVFQGTFDNDFDGFFVHGTPPPVPPPVVDTTPPVVSGFDPAPGTQITRTQAIDFDVTDDSGLFARIFVVAFFKSTGVQEVIHDGTGFVGFFTATSSRVVIANGFRYTVLRSGGWTEAPTIRVFPIDAAGNE